ncbi:MAG TPA: hypothetical protein VG713_17005, partial [Pirellulales bacterium]|nr:hypothetical protein [Pirellulales bacterium]
MPRYCSRRFDRRAIAAGWLVSCLVSLAAPRAAWPQTAAPAKPPEALSQADVQSELRALSESTNLAPELQQKAAALYNQALNELSLAENWQTKEAAFREERAAAPKELEE